MGWVRAFQRKRACGEGAPQSKAVSSLQALGRNTEGLRFVSERTSSILLGDDPKLSSTQI
jgi:hypothetical protein